jgi:hypothetical protein
VFAVGDAVYEEPVAPEIAVSAKQVGEAPAYHW